MWLRPLERLPAAGPEARPRVGSYGELPAPTWLVFAARGRHLGRTTAFGLALVLIGAIAAIDHLSGERLSLSIFYLLPVTLVTIASGQGLGLVVSCFAAAAWLVADLGGAPLGDDPIPVWNALVRLGYFALHSSLVFGLVTAIAREQARSHTDSLTGCSNWRHFQGCAERELGRARRTGRPFTLCYMDLDDFKRINDALGHDAGDDVLRALAAAVQGHIRSSDVLARLGGDEFAVLLPETDRDAAEATLARLRGALAPVLRSGPLRSSLSMGAITFRSAPGGVDEMVRRCDELMYRVKREGKDGLRHEVWSAVGGGA